MLSAITSAHPDLRPTRYGSYEPLPYQLAAAADVSEILTHWENPVFWNAGSRSEGSFFFGATDLHSAIYLSCTASRVSHQIAVDLTQRLAVDLQADIAAVYYQREDDPYACRDERLKPPGASQTLRRPLWVRHQTDRSRVEKHNPAHQVTPFSSGGKSFRSDSRSSSRTWTR
jgi:hypothetical protein